MKITMLKISFISVFCFFLMNDYLYAQLQLTNAPKYSNEFLSIGTGARSMAMSGSVIASVDDGTAGYWNPSRLYLMRGDRQVNLMHAEYFAGIAKYDYGSFGILLDSASAIAFSFIRFGVDNIPNTIDLIDSQGNIHYDKITTFSIADMAFLISYGKKLKTENLSVGGSVKIIRRRYGNFAGAWGFGIDFATTYQYGNMLFAAVARDATSTFNAWSFNLSDRMKEVFTITENVIPENTLEITSPSLLLATARTINISRLFSILPEAGMHVTFDGKRNVPIKTNIFSIAPLLGIEMSYKNFIYLRAGVGNIQKETNRNGKSITSYQPNMGVGINITDRITFDYALTDIADRSIALNSNIFSLRLSFYQQKNKNIE